jgi:hypothetical protein
VKKCSDRDPSNIGEGELQFYQWSERELLYRIPEDDVNTGWLTKHNL